MPYRRLPNTDKARLRALNTALKLGDTLLPNELAYSQAIYAKIKSFLPIYKHTIDSYKDAHINQVKSSKTFLDNFKKARLYISHFIQVFNLAVIRNEINPADRKYLGLDPNDNRVPSLNTEQEVIDWGKKILEGESIRISKGGNPILTPRIAVVKVWYDKYIDSFRFQKTLQDISNRSLNKVAEQRKIADSVIVDLWNEVESNYKRLPLNIMREKSKIYGVVYVQRGNEKAKAERNNLTIAYQTASST